MEEQIKDITLNLSTLEDYSELRTVIINPTNRYLIPIAVVDIDLMIELHNYRAVKNLKDRRKDLLELKLKRKK